ncbi:MAG: 50S ribosomal protein L9 [Microthrixaceae bacterium]
MIDVKVVLRANVEGLGRRGDMVEVSPGYARNYLVPRHLAIVATAGVEQQAEAMRKAQSARDARDRAHGEEIATALVSRPVTVKARAAGGGKLFGSVTSSEIAQAVAEQAGIDLDRKAIHLDEHLKTTGTHQVSVRLPGDVEFPLTVEIVGS